MVSRYGINKDGAVGVVVSMGPMQSMHCLMPHCPSGPHHLSPQSQNPSNGMQPPPHGHVHSHNHHAPPSPSPHAHLNHLHIGGPHQITINITHHQQRQNQQQQPPPPPQPQQQYRIVTANAARTEGFPIPGQSYGAQPGGQVGGGGGSVGVPGGRGPPPLGGIQSLGQTSAGIPPGGPTTAQQAPPQPPTPGVQPQQPQGPAQTTTPPVHTSSSHEMGKQPHLQSQPTPLPVYGQNQSRIVSQGYYQSGPRPQQQRGLAHRGGQGSAGAQVMNMPVGNGQQTGMYTHPPSLATMQQVLVPGQVTGIHSNPHQPFHNPISLQYTAQPQRHQTQHNQFIFPQAYTPNYMYQHQIQQPFFYPPNHTIGINRAGASGVSGGAQHLGGPLIGAQGNPVVPQSTLQQPTQQPQPMAMGMPVPQPEIYMGQHNNGTSTMTSNKKRRKHALDIVNPETQKSIELYSDDAQTESADSSNQDKQQQSADNEDALKAKAEFTAAISLRAMSRSPTPDTSESTKHKSQIASKDANGSSTPTIVQNVSSNSNASFSTNNQTLSQSVVDSTTVKSDAKPSQVTVVSKEFEPAKPVVSEEPVIGKLSGKDNNNVPAQSSVTNAVPSKTDSKPPATPVVTTNLPVESSSNVPPTTIPQKDSFPNLANKSAPTSSSPPRRKSQHNQPMIGANTTDTGTFAGKEQKDRKREEKSGPGPRGSTQEQPQREHHKTANGETVTDKVETPEVLHNKNEPVQKSADGKAMQKQKSKSKIKNRDLNRRGAEKEGTDMDAFVNTVPPSKIETTTEPAAVKQQPQQHSNKESSVQKDTNKEMYNVAKELTTKDMKENENHESKKEKESIQNEKMVSSLELPKEESMPASLEKTQLTTMNSNNESALTNEDSAKTTSVSNKLPNKTDDVVDHAKPSNIKTDNVDLKAIVAQKNEENSKVSALRSTPMTSPAADVQEKAVEEKKAVENETPLQSESPTPASTPAAKSVPARPVLRYKYSEDQWSPINPTGRKIYSRDFLMEIQEDPQCKIKPGHLPDVDAILKDMTKNRSPMEQRISNNASMNRSDALFPGFVRSSTSGPKTLSSYTKKSNVGGRSKPSSKSGSITVSLSLREDVKLRETQNAWKPMRLKTNATSEEDEKTEKLYKKVRSVLNKLTPEKFSKLVEQVRSLEIDTQERLEGVINLVFEKAIDEPNFSEAYALMCKEVSNMKVTNNESQEQSSTNFKKLIIHRCQTMFEKHAMEENTTTVDLQKKIDECKDPEKKKELQIALEEEKRLIRMKYVGNMRFIGELFKQGVLTVKIMHQCILPLLENQNEENLECLCKLLTTIGKSLEQKSDLTDCFKRMERIANQKGPEKISSRIRFMIQDVIDLRKNAWVPRRTDINPKTISQIQKDVETERLNSQVGFNNPPLSTPRKDDRGMDRKRNRAGPNDDGWSDPIINRTRQSYSVETAKLKNKPPSMDDLQLGSRQNYLWCKNVQTGNTKTTLSTNKFTILDSVPTEPDKRISLQFTGSRSTGGSREFRSEFKSNYDRSNTRNGSHQMNSGSSSRESSVLDMLRSQSMSMPPPSMTKSASQSSTTSDSKSEVSKEKLRKYTHEIIEQFLSNLDFKNAALDVKEKFNNSTFTVFVRETINDSLEKKSNLREKVAELLLHLLSTNVISVGHFKAGFAEVVEAAYDLIIDIPMVYEYLAEILYHPVQKGLLPLSDMRSILEPLKKQGYVGKMMGELLVTLIQVKGANWVSEKWHQSGLQWSEIVDVNMEDINEIIKNYKLEFLNEDNKVSYGSSELSLDYIRIQLVKLMKDSSFDAICSWIQSNVGDRTKDPQFIRVLMTAILETSIVEDNRYDVYEFKKDTFSHLESLISRFVDANEEFELQCLFAIQAYMHKLKHPRGIMVEIFNKLLENNILSSDAFLTWESDKNPAEQDGKGVAVKMSTSFFTSLKEPEGSSDDELPDTSKDKDSTTTTTTTSTVQSVSQSSSLSQDCRG